MRTAAQTAVPPLVERLRAARARIADVGQYRCGEGAYDAQGEPTDPNGPGAVKWSGWGALETIAGATQEDVAALDAAAWNLPGQDGEARKQTLVEIDGTGDHAAVLAVYDAAIAAAEPALQTGSGAPVAQPQGRLFGAQRATADSTHDAARPDAAPAQQTAPAKNDAPRDPAPPQVPQVYRDVRTLYDAFSKSEQRHFNVLLPTTRIDYIPDGHSVSLRVITLDPTPPDSNGNGGGGDVYLPERGDASKLAPSARALAKISAAAGINWDPVLSVRQDDGSDQHYCWYLAVGWVQDFDGSWRCISADKEVDLREGSTTIEGWKPKRLAIAREHILRLTQTKARNAAIRQALAMKQAYSPDELKRPFVVPKLIHTGDYADPELKRAIALERARQGMQATTALFGPGRERAATAPLGHPGGDAMPAQVTRLPPPPVGGRRTADDGDDFPY